MTDSENDIPLKLCTGPCGRSLPATPEFFYRKKGTKDGLMSQCKTCKREYAREYERRPEGREKINARKRARYQRPDIREKHLAKQKAYHDRQEVREHRSVQSKEYNSRPEVRERSAARNKVYRKTYHRPPQVRERDRMRNKAYRNRMSMREEIPASDIPSEKQCSVCEKTFPATPDFFNRDRSRKQGLHDLCKTCKQAKDRKRLQTHKERIRERRRQVRALRRDEINARLKASWLIHGSKYNERKRMKMASDPEYAQRVRDGNRRTRQKYGHIYNARRRANEEYRQKSRERDRRRYAARKLYARNYRKTHPEIMRALDMRHSHKRRALKRNVPGEFTAEQIREQLQHQRYRCYYMRCGQSKFPKDKTGKYGYRFQIEHIIPLSRPEHKPSNDMSNIVLACESCNASKHNKLPHEWIEGGRLF